MTILVTGCAGFIGYHVVKALTGKGHIVVGIDNLNTYYDLSLKEERLKGLTACNNFTFIKLDICDKDGMKKLFESFRFDRVCHLAAQAGVRYSFENPQAYIDSNITGFGNIVRLCSEYMIPHFIYASSSSVYGKNSKIPFSENDLLEGQVSLYAETKRKNEIEAEEYFHKRGLNNTGLRFFTVYGPWGRPDMAPFIFMDAISHDRPIRLFNSGEMWRDFTYIDDIVKGVVLIIEAGCDGEAKCRILNIGKGSPVYLPDFIKTMEEVIGKKAIKVMAPMQKGDVIRTYADTSLIEKEIGYKPDTPLKKGMEELEMVSLFLRK